MIPELVAIAQDCGFINADTSPECMAFLNAFAAAIAEKCARIAKAKAETERTMARSGEISKADGFICAATATEIEEAILAAFPLARGEAS